MVFDSGVGGLSIYDALVAYRPDLEYLFVSDNQQHPYGTKTEQALTQRVVAVIEALVRQLLPDLVVIACNTASTIVLPTLRDNFTVPFVGVVPAIKPAARITKSGKIVVLGTPATAQRQYTQALIEKFASDCDVLKLGSSLLVELAEQKLRNESIDLEALHQELRPIIEFEGCDTLVLSCTHFPLLYKEINDFVNVNSEKNSVSIIDSGSAVARRVGSLLPPLPNSAKPSSGSWMTADPNHSDYLMATLATKNLPYQGVLSVEP